MFSDDSFDCVDKVLRDYESKLVTSAEAVERLKLAIEVAKLRTELRSYTNIKALGEAYSSGQISWQTYCQGVGVRDPNKERELIESDLAWKVNHGLPIAPAGATFLKNREVI